MIQNVDLTIPEICEKVLRESDRILTHQILTMFQENGLTYKVRTDGNTYRIYCYIRKSKETLIINTIGYKYGKFEIQLRIQHLDTLNKLERFPDSFRKVILIESKNCKMPHCCNCGNEYVFAYDGEEYRKCHMLCDNFLFYDIGPKDGEALLSIITDEIAAKTRKK